MKTIINYCLFLCFFTLNLNAGDYCYEWENVGYLGLGEIDNKLLIYCGDDG